MTVENKLMNEGQAIDALLFDVNGVTMHLSHSFVAGDAMDGNSKTVQPGSLLDSSL